MMMPAPAAAIGKVQAAPRIGRLTKPATVPITARETITVGEPIHANKCAVDVNAEVRWACIQRRTLLSRRAAPRLPSVIRSAMPKNAARHARANTRPTITCRLIVLAGVDGVDWLTCRNVSTLVDYPKLGSR